MRFVLAALILVTGLSACGTDNPEGNQRQAEERSTASGAPATSPPATTSPEPDPMQTLIGELVPLFEDVDASGLDYFQTGTSAYLYYESLVLLEGPAPVPPDRVRANEDGMTLGGGVELADFGLNAAGKIEDMSRNGTPLSRTVVAGGVTFEGIDEGEGIIGEVHSFRHFDGVLQLIITTTNRSAVEGYLSFGDYVSGGQQFSQAIGNPVRPGASMTYLEAFEGAPSGGGVAYGHIWADGIGVREVELTVPPLAA